MTTLETQLLSPLRRWKSSNVARDVLHHGRDYASTLLTEFSVMAGQILLYKLAAHYLGKIGFSEYALARRTISMLFPIPLLGLSVGLPRYIGFANGLRDHVAGSRYYGATLWCVGSVSITCVVFINLFARSFAQLFFGDPGYRYLALPMSLMILGLCLHTVVCSYFRGNMRMKRANVLQFLNLAVVPAIGFLLFGQSLAKVLTAIGSISTLVAIGSLMLTPVGTIFQDNCKEAMELLRYGVQRVPGDFILMALFTLPATFVAHVRGVAEAGFVAFGISVVNLIGSLFAPIGLVLVPKATSMFAEGAHEELRRHLKLILRVAAIVSVLIVTCVWVTIPELTRLYLGTGFEQVVPIVRLLIIGAVPLSFYFVLRNLVDAYHEFGVTAAILAIGLAVFLITCYADRSFSSSAFTTLIGFLLSQVVIAGLSGFECRRILRTLS